MLPAPGQGALAVQCREDDAQTIRLLSAIEHPDTRRAVSAERAFLAGLGGGCSLPVGALAEVRRDEIVLRGVIAGDDVGLLRLSAAGHDPEQVGADLARQVGNRTLTIADVRGRI
jgi:hydroxymethylbilane synthase